MPPLQPEDFVGDADDIIDMAVKEMGHRLLTDADSIPAHVLIKLVAEANKAQERRAAEAARLSAVNDEKDEIEVILSSELPSEKKLRLLEAALARLEQRIKRLREILERGEF